MARRRQEHCCENICLAIAFAWLRADSNAEPFENFYFNGNLPAFADLETTNSSPWFALWGFFGEPNKASSWEQKVLVQFRLHLWGFSSAYSDMVKLIWCKRQLIAVTNHTRRFAERTILPCVRSPRSCRSSRSNGANSAIRLWKKQRNNVTRPNSRTTSRSNRGCHDEAASIKRVSQPIWTLSKNLFALFSSI